MSPEIRFHFSYVKLFIAFIVKSSRPEVLEAHFVAMDNVMIDTLMVRAPGGTKTTCEMYSVQIRRKCRDLPLKTNGRL